jgi:hypothetical protein
MNIPIRLSFFTVLVAVSNVSAATLYVSLESTNPAPPYPRDALPRSTLHLRSATQPERLTP